jgi:hypothetical protein
MYRILTALIAVAFVAAPAAACPFCGGEARARQTLRTHLAQAKVVILGQLKNPRFDPKTDEGSTELHATTLLKDDPVRRGQTVIVLRTYLPVIGNTPADFVAFCGVIDGRLDASFGMPATPALVEYLKGLARLDDDPVARLGFYFRHLDAAEAAVAADAFYEFARASDADVAKAAKSFDPARLRRLMADPATPADRLGVFAYLLGVCGGPADLAFLAGLLNETPRPERTAAAFGGLLAAYTLLNPKDGWAYAAAILNDPKQPFAIRLATINSVRFFQATRAAASKAEVLRCCAVVIAQGDLADQAIEDLRRWGYWDLTADVLGQFGKPTHDAPIVRNCIVRYALTCPDDAAKRFVTALRQSEPKLVQSVEASLELYKTAGK